MISTVNKKHLGSMIHTVYMEHLGDMILTVGSTFHSYIWNI